MGERPDGSWLQRFPIMMFSIVMGLSGLVIVYEKVSFLFGLSPVPQILLLVFTGALFLLLAGIFSVKLVRYPDSVIAEFRHPVKVSFFSAIPISILLLSIALYNDLSPLLGIVLWYIGVPVLTVMLLFVFSRWIRLDFDIIHANPAWFIPIVGTILVPVVGVDVAPRLVSVAYFGIGFFFWISFFAIKFYRIVFHKQMAQRFVPTLFIFMAPPAVGFVAYFRITGTLDMFGYELYGITLFFFALFVAMFRHFVMPKFFISWWAFTFPLDAVAIATLLIYEVTRSPAFMVLSVFFTVVATLAVGAISLTTLAQFKSGALLDEA